MKTSSGHSYSTNTEVIKKQDGKMIISVSIKCKLIWVKNGLNNAFLAKKAYSISKFNILSVYYKNNN